MILRYINLILTLTLALRGQNLKTNGQQKYKKCIERQDENSSNFLTLYVLYTCRLWLSLLYRRVLQGEKDGTKQNAAKHLVKK